MATESAAIRWSEAGKERPFDNKSLMLGRLRILFRDPFLLLILAAGLLAFVVQSGELGTSDTGHRLQAAHAMWTSEPPVFPQEYPDFGVRGRGGKIQSWYGIGQSLLMLPADIVATWVATWPAFRGYGDDPTVRDIIVSYSTNILLTVLTALVCFRLLLQFRFAVRHAVAGTLALLIATTHLHYTQNLMENNSIFLLTLAGFSYQYEWLKTGSRRALLFGSAAFGLNLLTRITTGIDLLAGALFLLLALWFAGVRGRALWERFREYVAVVLPVTLFFGLLDRLYQFYRFGSWFTTYLGLASREARLRDPSLPANFPFEKPFHEGFFGALFAPEKSIFLFDPLLLLTIVLVVWGWRRFRPVVRAYLVASGVLLLAYLSFYAKYTVWSGDSAWGDRYVSTAVELAVLLAVPLLLEYRRETGPSAVGRGRCAGGGECRHSGGVAGVLAAARVVPDADEDAPDVRGVAAAGEYCRVRAGQDGRVGPGDVGRLDRGRVGLRPHHDLELPAVLAAAGRRGAEVGRRSDVRGLERRSGGADGDAGPVAAGARPDRYIGYPPGGWVG